MSDFFFVFDGQRYKGFFSFEPIADYNVISVWVNDDHLIRIVGEHFHFLKHIHPHSSYCFGYRNKSVDQEKQLKTAIIEGLVHIGF